MREMGVFFSGLVRELGGLREAAVQGLSSVQTEHEQLEGDIRRAQEKHQTVRFVLSALVTRSRKCESQLLPSECGSASFVISRMFEAFARNSFDTATSSNLPCLTSTRNREEHRLPCF